MIGARLGPLTAGLVLIGIAVALASCQGKEEEATLTKSPRATGSTPSATGDFATPSLSVSPTPAPTASAGAADWQPYSDPEQRFTLRYPPGWFLEDGATSQVRPPGELTSVFSSFSPGTVSEFPAVGLKVDLYVYAPVPGRDCRTGTQDSTAASFGGTVGWRRTMAETAVDDGRSDSISAYREGYCYSLTAYFGRDNNNDALFSEMIDSFQFSGATPAPAS